MLARHGRRVVVVDLDLEAPGLSSVFKSQENPSYGIIDYFYSHAYTSQENEPSQDDEIISDDPSLHDDGLPQDEEQLLSVASILGEVEIPDAPGHIYLVPAGELNLNYLAKIEDLSTTIATRTGESLWTTFLKEINQYVKPDIVLVDSRTGLNKWGAFTLLRAADKAVVFLYPNEQNMRGIELLLDALAGRIDLQLVFSPVPSGEVGEQIVQKYWSQLQKHQKRLTAQEIEAEIFASEQPIKIPYITELALAPNFPVPTLFGLYEKIADAIDQEATLPNLDLAALDKQRQKIVESLQIPQIDEVVSSKDLPHFFQRTNYFDKLLEETTCLIQGRKGIGKTTLYALFIKHFEIAQRYALRRIDHVRCLSGHSSFDKNPLSKEDFVYLADKIAEVRKRNRKITWVDLWRAYLLLRLYQEDVLQQFTVDTQFSELYRLLNTFPKVATNWSDSQKDTFTTLFSSEEHIASIQNWLQSIYEQLSKNTEALDVQLPKKTQAIWFLFDDLETSLPVSDRRNALGGLFILAREFSIKEQNALQFKIFLRESTWNWLKVPHKEFFNGRSISLQWTYTDFLRLALRLAQQSSAFKDLVNQISDVPNIDLANETVLNQALQLLWGLWKDGWGSEYVSEWMYKRLSDFSSTIYPGDLYVLLRAAISAELKLQKSKVLLQDNRLLQIRSLNSALEEVSRYRCNELREEYPDLNAFFDALKGHSVSLSDEEFYDLWEELIPKQSLGLCDLRDFREFMYFLIDIGLL